MFDFGKFLEKYKGNKINKKNKIKEKNKKKVKNIKSINYFYIIFQTYFTRFNFLYKY